MNKSKWLAGVGLLSLAAGAQAHTHLKQSTVPAPTLAPGEYVVNWRVVSEDNHVMSAPFARNGTGKAVFVPRVGFYPLFHTSLRDVEHETTRRPKPFPDTPTGAMKTPPGLQPLIDDGVMRGKKR